MKKTIRPVLCTTVAAVALMAAGCGSDPVLAPEAETPETSQSALLAGATWLPLLSDCVERNPLDFLDSQGRTVGCATVPAGDDDVEPMPIIVAFGVGVAAGLVAAMIWEVLQSNPPWFRIAKEACRNYARQNGWQQWGIGIEFAANGEVVEWNCRGPDQDGFDDEPN